MLEQITDRDFVLIFNHLRDNNLVRIPHSQRFPVTAARSLIGKAVLTRAGWDSYTWNPPQNDFYEDGLYPVGDRRRKLDPNASDKPTWEYLIGVLDSCQIETDFNTYLDAPVTNRERLAAGSEEVRTRVAELKTIIADSNRSVDERRNALNECKGL